MKCFYHKDADGKCAGYLVSQVMSADDYGDEYIGIDYKMKFPMESIRKNEVVYIVDYSISPKDMIQLLNKTPFITWIDHHQTAIDMYKDHADITDKIKGIRLSGFAGCMLTYCYFNHMTDDGNGWGLVKPFDISMTEDAPYFVKLIADWDVWTFAYGDDTRNFQAAFYAYDNEPEDSFWKEFKSPWNFKEGELIGQGIIINKYKKSWAKTYVKENGYEAMFEGHLCYVLNLGLANSTYFESVWDKCDIFIPFSFDGERYKFSMYSKETDVSAICVKHGGGGHIHAAGFQSKTIPFIKLIR